MLALFARQAVAALAAKTQETTHLAVREGNQAALVHHQLTQQPVGVSTGSGHCVPLYCTSAGRALLIDFDRDQLIALLGNGPLAKFNKRTIGSIDELAEECCRSRQRGYAVDDQEYHDGVRCLAAPIRDASGEVIASIGVSAPVDRLPKARLDNLARQVIEAAGQVGVMLGQAALPQTPAAAAVAGVASVFVGGDDNDQGRVGRVRFARHGRGVAVPANQGPDQALGDGRSVRRPPRKQSERAGQGRGGRL